MTRIARSAILTTLAAVLLSGAASATEADTETLSVAVPYGDLDLTTEAGRTALDTRIEAAVEEVCPRPAMFGNLKAMDTWAACRRGAEASAAEQIGAADIATETFAVLF